MTQAVRGIVLLTCALSFSAFAQTPLTVEKLVESVKSSIKLKLPDKEVAAYLANVRLTAKLEDKTIEDLQTEGAGPRTVAALTRLADQSVNLAAPAPPPPPKPVSTGPSPPSKEVQDRVLHDVREYALNYLQSLPNFLCLQVTRRSMDTHYKAGGDPSWTPIDNFAEKLSYVDHRESYELIGGKAGERPGGALSRNEWASMMGLLFDPESETSFHWERWTSIDKKLYHVYEYSVDRAHSRETLEVDKQQSITPAYHGEIFVPHDANVIWRITVIPDIPGDFPMQDVKETLKYDYVDINGQRYLLPLSSEVTMRVGRVGNHNEIDFRRYQKYSADAKLTFDDVDDGTDIKVPVEPDTKPDTKKGSPGKP